LLAGVTRRNVHAEADTRPALVVSPAEYNHRVGLALVCPIMNRAKGYPFEVVIPEGVSVSGVVLSDQVKSLDWKARCAELLCALPDAVVTETSASSRLFWLPGDDPCSLGPPSRPAAQSHPAGRAVSRALS